MGFVLGWIILSFIVAFIGDDRKIGYWGTFFLSLLLSPIIGALFAIASSRKNENTYSRPSYEFLQQKENNENIEKTNTASKIEQLEKLALLKEKGILNQDEFDKEKKEILAGNSKENFVTNEENKENCIKYKDQKIELIKGFRCLISNNEKDIVHMLILVNSKHIVFDFDNYQFNDYRDNIYAVLFFLKNESVKYIENGVYSTNNENINADIIINQKFGIDEDNSLSFSSVNFKLKEWDDIYDISFNGILETNDEIQGSFTGNIEKLPDMKDWLQTEN